VSKNNQAELPVLHSKKSKWGWSILVGLASLLILNGVHLYLFIVETAPQQTIAILLAGFGVLALVTALDGFRYRVRRAQTGMWVVLVVMTAISLHMFRHEQIIIGSWYAILAIIAMIGLLLVYSKQTDSQ